LSPASCTMLAMGAGIIRIGILGDFNPEFRSHHATNDSLQHAAAKLGVKLESRWLPTPSLLNPTAAEILASFDALWASPGSPYQSMDGMLRGIQFAREQDWPFLGTCGGFQYTLIEVARNVVGLADADSAENHSGSKHIVIYPVACEAPNPAANGPKLSGRVGQIRLRPGSFLQSFYGKDVVEEEFFCNFEINPEYEYCTMEAGLPTVARGANGEVRAIESPTHRFFVATLFQPQLSSTTSKPHPLILGLLKAAVDFVKEKPEANILG
jgi:CTP synthase (UTP-ammonia lyase)